MIYSEDGRLFTQTTQYAWHCERCRKLYRAEPHIDRQCRCETPVIPLRPCRVTTIAYADGGKS